MNNDITKKWIEAAVIIRANPNAEILCPVCQNSYLQIIDVQIKEKIERHLICKKCNAYNAMLFRVEVE